MVPMVVAARSSQNVWVALVSGSTEEAEYLFRLSGLESGHALPNNPSLPDMLLLYKSIRSVLFDIPNA